MAGLARATGIDALRTLLHGEAETVFRCRSLQATISTHRNNYTVIRFALSASVIFFHAFAISSDQSLQNPTNRFLWPITDMGGLAVQLFFFLSGLFVSQSYLSDPNLLRFVAKRFLRIFPGLFACVLTTALVAVILSAPGQITAHLTSRPFYQYVVDNARLDLNWFIPGIFTAHRYQAINGSIHTLPMEWKMYMTMSVMSLLGFLASRRLIASSAIILFTLSVLPPTVTPQLNVLFNADYSRSVAALFAAGMFCFSVARFVHVPWWLALMATLATLASHGPAHSLLFYVSAVAWVIYLGEAPWLMRVVHPRTDLSYGVYIYGWPMEQLSLVLFGAGLGPYAVTAASLPMAMACAYGSWHLIERPAIRFGHRLKDITQRGRGRLPGQLSLSVLSALFVLCVAGLWLGR